MLFICLLLGYLSGSLATAIWISKAFYGKDIRSCGSGNAGASNMFRTFGWRPALIVTLLDIAKGAWPLLLVPYLLPTASPSLLGWTQVATGAAAIAGHIWTVFAGFRGGKGVATAAGVLAVLATWPLLASLAAYALVTWRTRISALGSLTAACLFPLFMLATAWCGPGVEPPVLTISLAVPLALIWTHRHNLDRLRRGTENKLSDHPEQG